jgi:hypothetical protein
MKFVNDVAVALSFRLERSFEIVRASQKSF